MPSVIDLSHTLEPGMPRFSAFDAPHVGAVWTHAEAAARGYRDTTCEVTEVRFAADVSTRFISRHRRSTQPRKRWHPNHASRRLEP
jgi:hypothetical protein